MPTHKSPKPAVDSMPLHSVGSNLLRNQISLKSDKVEILTILMAAILKMAAILENLKLRGSSMGQSLLPCQVSD